MGDSEGKPTIPSWQRDAQSDVMDVETPASETAVATPADEDHLDVARRFLQDDAVRDQPREKKVEFLKEKGIKDGDIETLLAESPPAQATDNEPSAASSSSSTALTSSAPSQSSDISHASATDRPPIVTYPEFLTQPPRPPPLVTTTSLLTALSTFAGLATLLHGTSRYLLEPMHESLTDARLDFHATAADRLDALVSRLEETVSSIPPLPSNKKASSTATSDDAESEADDPTEMFHRDIGTQTSSIEDLPPSKASAPPASEIQATRLKVLVDSLEPVKQSFRTQSEDFHDIGTLIDVFRDDLQNMVPGGGSTNPIYGHGALNGYSYQLPGQKEPDDEIKKAKDGIRRVKGLLLSTRNFPASTV